jgi:phage shock protein PspC (stress-responsive transcriptional regulator)
MLAGVAGGMAEYLDVDPTVVRVLWIIVGVFSGGLAILAYIVLALVTPQAPYAAAPGGWTTAGAAAPGWNPPAGTTGWTNPPAAPAWGSAPGWTAAPAAPARPRQDRAFGAAAIVGVVLIVFGALALIDVAIPSWISGAVIGPAVILALGAALLLSSVRRRPEEAAPAPAAAPAAAPAPTTGEATGWEVGATQPIDPATYAPVDQGTASEPGTHPA